MQSSLNAELGELNLACLLLGCGAKFVVYTAIVLELCQLVPLCGLRYGTFTVLCLVVPPVLSHLERWLGMQWLLALCSAAYAAMVPAQVLCCTPTIRGFFAYAKALSNVIKVPATPSPMWAVTAPDMSVHAR